jgi:hypothetical protein
LSPAHPYDRLVKRTSEKDFAGWWADLISEDAQRAYGAVWRLAESPHDATIKFLRARLKPAADANYNEVRQLIGDLDSDAFAVREKAFKRLEELGNAAVPAMREVLEKQPSLEVRRRLETLLSRPPGLVRSSETLRNLRATQVLELIASNEARQLLAEIAKGVPHAIETKEAKASLERLNQRVGITD